MAKRRTNKLPIETNKSKNSMLNYLIRYKDYAKHSLVRFKSQSRNHQLIIIIAGFLGAILFAYIPLALVKKNMPSVAPTENEVITKPQKLTIPRFNLEMPVREATVTDNEWQIYPDAVSWLKTSGDLGQGNIVLYAHNYKDSFGMIIRLGKNDNIIVSNEHKTRTFKVVRAFQTKPTDLTAIKETKDQLTLYTCSGWFDANRFVVIATPVE